jgi:hypothetical protein
VTTRAFYGWIVELLSVPEPPEQWALFPTHLQNPLPLVSAGQALQWNNEPLPAGHYVILDLGVWAFLLSAPRINSLSLATQSPLDVLVRVRVVRRRGYTDNYTHTPCVCIPPIITALTSHVRPSPSILSAPSVSVISVAVSPASWSQQILARGETLRTLLGSKPPISGLSVTPMKSDSVPCA